MFESVGWGNGGYYVLGGEGVFGEEVVGFGVVGFIGFLGIGVES